MRERPQAMLERVTAEAAAAIGSTEAQRVRAALAAALEKRARVLADDHDPRLLHPARTIRILLADAACRSPTALAAAAFVDTIDPELGAPPPTGAVGDLARAVPVPEHAEDELVERLVTAAHDVAIVALAERLDQVRHLHLRSGLDVHRLHRQVRTAYAPAARRISAALARRFDRWADAFERRLILPR